MKNEMQQLDVVFHNRAGEVMQALFREFKYTVAAIDRQWDENVFQQQQGKYTALLKHRLQGIAFELMGKLEPGADRDQWNWSVSRFIGEYLQEFGQKIRSL